ncbi:head-tail connector protein, partial [Ventosimonas gracilis]
MLDLTPLKHHLRIDHDDEDALLTAYLNAAK